MLGGLWAVSIKVPNLEQELEFHRKLGNNVMKLGGTITCDYTFELEGESFRAVFIETKEHHREPYLCLTEKPIIEQMLGESLPFGVTHLIYFGGKWEMEETADEVTAAGATLLGGPFHLRWKEKTPETPKTPETTAAFFRSPGGCIFELFVTEAFDRTDWIYYPRAETEA